VIDRSQDEEWIRLGELALNEASDTALEQQPHRAIDALVNLAWLHYYVDDVEGMNTTLDRVTEIVPDDYFITQESGLPKGTRDQPWHWVQLGKMHLLRGHVAFNQYLAADAEFKETRTLDDSDPDGLLRKALEALEKSAASYTLSLAYDELYGRGQVFRDMKGGIKRIHRRFARLNMRELGVVTEAIESTAKAYHLKKARLAELVVERFGLEEDPD
jgi:hypothetical protein